MALDALDARIREAIPMTRGLAFTLSRFEANCLTLEAPLAAHMNDKGTFFAGSQSLLLTLAGWSLTTLLAEAEVGPADVLAVHSELSYSAPVTSDMVILARPAGDELAAFCARLSRKGRARLAVEAEGRDAGGTVGAVFKASYLARRLA